MKTLSVFKDAYRKTSFVTKI